MDYTPDDSRRTNTSVAADVWDEPRSRHDKDSPCYPDQLSAC